MLDYTSVPLVLCGERIKFISECGDSGINKCKQGYDGAYGGVWWESGFSREDVLKV